MQGVIAGVSSPDFWHEHSKSVRSQPTPCTPLATHPREQDGRSVMDWAAMRGARRRTTLVVYFILTKAMVKTVRVERVMEASITASRGFPLTRCGKERCDTVYIYVIGFGDLLIHPKLYSPLSNIITASNHGTPRLTECVKSQQYHGESRRLRAQFSM
jgi:hypothetical protein